MLPRAIVVLAAASLFPLGVCAQTHTKSAAAAAANATPRLAAKYGSNPAVGKTFVHDGVALYYEVYGRGEPLLLSHGNGGSIGSFRAQIDYFRKHYTVVAMDSRDQGRSGDSPDDKITNAKMADDLAALIDHLGIGPVNVLGWSDGAINALQLGVRHPAKVKKIAAMAASLSPNADALYPEVVALIKSLVDSAPVALGETPQGKRQLKVMQSLVADPDLKVGELESITAPTLVLAGDHDLVRDEHTLEIFHHITNSELCIFPGATHMLPYDDPALFNAMVDHFFREPFVKRDRIKDMLASLHRARGSKRSPVE